MITKKTDNQTIDSKLALRRYFLEKYHGDGPIKVLDCCQATGKIWLNLRKTFVLDEYWGVDVVPRKGRLKIDSTRILNQEGWEANIVDIDTYGSPWKHWFRLLKTAPSHPVSVFLTIGVLQVMGGGYDHDLLRGCGIEFQKLKIPTTLGTKLSKRLVEPSIARARDFGFEIVECLEAENRRTREGRANCRYIGLHLRRA
jgi:hypothetical protein